MNDLLIAGFWPSHDLGFGHYAFPQLDKVEIKHGEQPQHLEGHERTPHGFVCALVEYHVLLSLHHKKLHKLDELRKHIGHT